MSKSETETNDVTEIFSPESARPYPKVPPRKTKTRRVGKIRILTHTPVKKDGWSDGSEQGSPSPLWDFAY